jgi:hypothetical protein
MISPRFPRITLRVCALLTALVLLDMPLQGETVDRIEKTLEAQPGGKLVVKTAGARIEVSTAPGTSVQIDIERKVSASSKEAEDAYLAERAVTIEQNGDTITIRQAGGASNWSLRDGWSRMRTKADFRYTLVVPARFDVDLGTSGGSINVRDLEGEVRADTSGGSIKCERIQGPVRADTSGGSVTLAACHGDARAETSGGSITAEDGTGNLEVDTSGGSIRVHKHRGEVRAETSGGSIRLEEIEGNVDAETSGGSIRATLLAPPTAECRLSTSGGGITVNLPADAAFAVDAETSGGGVRSDFEVAGSAPGKKTQRLRGAVNGGGPLIRLRTSGGSITLSKTGA